MKIKIIIISFFFISCGPKKESKAEKILRELEINRKVDSTMRSADEKIKQDLININWDTIDIQNSGIEITKAEFIKENEYSNYKSVRLYYKNNSTKNIKAIRFKWYGLNSFNEPADCSNISNPGFGAGYTDIILKSGKSSSGTWSALSRDGDKIVKAWPYEIIYEDGSKWKSDYKKLTRSK
jgi:hypothetical protein